MKKDKKIDELEKIIKSIEFAQKWRVINQIPFEELLSHLNDYIDLLEGRKEDV